MTKLAMVVGVLGLAACSGGSGAAAPATPTSTATNVPAGTGWWCQATGNTDLCFRVKEDCNAFAMTMEGNEFKSCVEATKASCVSYTQKGADKTDCFASAETCPKYAGFMASKDATNVTTCVEAP